MGIFGWRQKRRRMDKQGNEGALPLYGMTENMRMLESLLFVHSEIAQWEQVGIWLDMARDQVTALVHTLNDYYSQQGSSLIIREIGQGIQLATRPELHGTLNQRLSLVLPEPLSHASWEVLSIVAYRQPITRVEIEAIRQTGSERVLQRLMERGLVDEVGRKEAPGRPILYGTTEFFLQEFGLSDLSGLPPRELPPLE